MDLGMAGSVLGLGMVATNRGEYERARRHLAEAYATYQAFDGNAGIVASLSALGRLAVTQGEYEEARFHLTQARNHCHTDDVGVLAYLDLETVQLDRCLGHVSTAMRLAQACLMTFRAVGERRAEAETLVELGLLSLDQGKTTEAGGYLAKAAAIHLDLHNDLGLVHCLEGLAVLASMIDRLGVALMLASTSAAWRTRAATVRSTYEHAMFQRTLDHARNALDEATFREALHAGRTIPLDKASESAIERLTW
jgi:tetratricopeptide (TPR) repeat protein